MLTLKLKDGDGSITVMECMRATVTPGQRASRIDIIDERGMPAQFTVCEEGGDAVIAYIENSAGATTQVVKPR